MSAVSAPALVFSYGSPSRLTRTPCILEQSWSTQGTGQVTYWLNSSPLLLSLGMNPLHGSVVLLGPWVAARECREVRRFGPAQPGDEQQLLRVGGTNTGAPRLVPAHPGWEAGVVTKATLARK